MAPTTRARAGPGLGLVLALAMLAARYQLANNKLGRGAPSTLLAVYGQDGFGSAVVAAKKEILIIQALHAQRMAEARRRLALLTGERGIDRHQGSREKYTYIR